MGNGRRRLANEVQCPRCHTHRPRGVTTCPGLINKNVDGNFVIRKCADYPNGRRRLVQVCRKCTHMSSFEGRGGPKAMHMSNFEDWKTYKAWMSDSDDWGEAYESNVLVSCECNYDSARASHLSGMQNTGWTAEDNRNLRKELYSRRRLPSVPFDPKDPTRQSRLRAARLQEELAGAPFDRKDKTPVKCGVMTPKRYETMKLQKQVRRAFS